MKKRNFALLFPIMVLSLSINAQVDKTSKFDFQLSYGIGTSSIQNEGINTSLGTSSVGVLGTYQFTDKIGVSTGVSFLGLNGNGFNEKGNYNQTRGTLRIPVLINSNKYLTEKTQFFSSGGLFVNRTIEDIFEYVNSTEEFKSKNWSMGLQARLGISHDVYSRVAVGFAYNLQYNFSDFSKEKGTIDSRMSTNTFEIFSKFKF